MLLTPEKFAFEDSLGFLINKLKGYMRLLLDREISDLDVSAAQWVILVRIGMIKDCTAATLCRGSDYDTGSMTRMLDRLEDKGLIRRERSETDRRVIRLALTEAGQALCDQMPERLCKIGNQMTRGFTEEEYVLLKSLLRRLLDNAMEMIPREEYCATDRQEDAST